METNNQLSEKEKAKAIAHEIMNKRKKEDKKEHVKAASVYLFVIAGWNFIWLLLTYNFLPPISKIFIGFFAFLMLGLGIWAQKSPLIPLAIALGIYVFLTLISSLSIDSKNYLTLLSKVIPLGILSYATYNAYKTKEKRKRIDNPDIIDA